MIIISTGFVFVVVLLFLMGLGFFAAATWYSRRQDARRTRRLGEWPHRDETR